MDLCGLPFARQLERKAVEDWINFFADSMLNIDLHTYRLEWSYSRLRATTVSWLYTYGLAKQVEKLVFRRHKNSTSRGPRSWLPSWESPIFSGRELLHSRCALLHRWREWHLQGAANVTTNWHANRFVEKVACFTAPPLRSSKRVTPSDHMSAAKPISPRQNRKRKNPCDKCFFFWFSFPILLFADPRFDPKKPSHCLSNAQLTLSKFLATGSADHHTRIRFHLGPASFSEIQSLRSRN